MTSHLCDHIVVTHIISTNSELQFDLPIVTINLSIAYIHRNDEKWKMGENNVKNKNLKKYF